LTDIIFALTIPPGEILAYPTKSPYRDRRTETMTEQKICSCGEKHQGHLCVLKSKGMTELVQHLTENPTVACFICGSEANTAENVCEPVPLEGK
jgi:hypothetical protein